MRQMKKVTCYFDGCCEPKNPGGAMGCGSIVKVDGQTVFAEPNFYPANPNNTNNVSEYIAMGFVLKYILDNGLDDNDVTIMGDSQVAIKQMNGEYGINSGAYVKYAYRCKELIGKFRRKPVLFWIKRDQNTEADDLSKRKLTENNISIKTHSDDKTALTFGKYSGKSVNDIDDIQYLNWVLKNIRMKGELRKIIETRISQFEHLAK
jgi:ribonuclease HI